jgi:hypothetical protein
VARRSALTIQQQGDETMSYADPMARVWPGKTTIDRNALVDCIDACNDCAQACTACADADLAEAEVQTLIRCIRLDLDCADICAATMRVLTRQTAFDAAIARSLLQACVTACKTCGDECEIHAAHGMEHCRICAEACRRCEQACQRMLSALTA